MVAGNTISYPTQGAADAKGSLVERKPQKGAAGPTQRPAAPQDLSAPAHPAGSPEWGSDISSWTLTWATERRLRPWP